jgi:hypothetical protein
MPGEREAQERGLMGLSHFPFATCEAPRTPRTDAEAPRIATPGKIATAPHACRSYDS